MKKKEIIFRDIIPLRGPNIWTYRPVLEAWVDIGELEDYPSNKIPGFYERLSAWLPSLVEHRCSYEERGGFLRRVEEGTWVGHILEHITLELQNLAGLPGGFGKTRETSEGRGAGVPALFSLTGRTAVSSGMVSNSWTPSALRISTTVSSTQHTEQSSKVMPWSWS